MQFEYPLLETMKKNMVLTKEKSAIAYYRVRSETVMLTDFEKKQKTKKKVARALKRLKTSGGFEINLLPVNADIRGKMGAMRSLIDVENYAVGVDKLKKTAMMLENEMGMVYEYAWIIGVPLVKKDIAIDLKENVTRALNHVTETVVTGLGFDLALEEEWYKNYQEQEQEVYQNLSELLVERLTEDELYYYQAYQFLKNIPHERQDILASQNLDNLMATKINPVFSGGLKFQCEEGESYVSYLPVGDMGVFLDGNHLLEIVQKMPFPVEVKIQATFAESKGQLALSGRSSRARTRTKNIMQEAHLAGSKQKRKIIEGQASLDDLDKKIDDGVDIIDWKAYLVVCGSSKKQMQARKKYLINRFDGLGIPLLKAAFDNPYLFQSTLFGNFLRMKEKKWQHTSTIESFAELNFFTSLKAGTSLGYYFGRVDTTLEEKEDRKSILLNSKNLIYMNMFLANKQDVIGKKTNNPHWALTGDTGNGKSVTAKKLFMECATLKDRVLYIDPKKEMRCQFMRTIDDPTYQKKYPLDVAFVHSFNFVTLDVRDKKNRGVLDPIVLFDETEAIATAKAMLTNIYEGTWNLKQKTEINETIAAVVKERKSGNKVGFWHVIERLAKSPIPDVEDMGRFLLSTIKESILELAFSHGETPGLSFEKKVTILEIEDLDLPTDKNEHMDENKRLSVTLMFALGTFCSKFGSRNPKEETVTFFDESWIFQSSPEGKAILKSMKRIGRSFNNFLVLITQSVNDLDDKEDGTGFGTVICFDEVQNREGILSYLNLPNNEQNMKWVSNMVQGQCLLKDMFGQTNRVVVHVLFEEWLELFKTVDDTEASVMENRFAV
ncbi:ATP-binding protein [Enterococcus sp. DIV1368c]|uniref:ATP-binding protein n=1 Tax=Enterococcus sp. DIV1368c TaxID=2774815 RepID=UPI003F1E682D